MARHFLILVSAAAIVSLTAWLIVIFRLDPCRVPGEAGCETLSPLSVVLFFVSLFFALMAVFTLLGYLLRRAFHEEYTFEQMTVSLRQGFLLAFLSCGSLLLLIFEVLTWWSGLLFLAFVTLIEMYFLAKR